MLFDKARGARMKPLDLFASKAAFDAAVQRPFCAILNKQRAERRGEAVKSGSDDPFDQCVVPSEQTVILGSGDHQHFTRIGFLIGPYSAGPYAEGTYEITLSVTPAVLAAVRPGYASAFAVGR